MKIIKLAALALSALAPFHAFADLTIVRTSAPGTGPTGSQSISGDGKVHAFSTTSTYTVITDGNGVEDIYVRNLTNADLKCASASYPFLGTPTVGNGASTNPSISADGRYIAFQSAANNLGPVDSNGKRDIYVFDRSANTNKRVSVTPAGGPAAADCVDPSISADGSTIAFASADANLFDPTLGANSYIYVVKREAAGTYGSMVRVPVPDAPGGATKECRNPSISGDGNFVAYEFNVSDNSPSFFYQDIFVYNLTTHQTTRITGSYATDGVAWDGRYSQNPSISGDGSVVAFESNVGLTSEKANVDPAEYLLDVFVARIGESITYRLASKDTLGNLANPDDSDSYNSSTPAISQDGRFVSFQTAASNFYQGATNFYTHIYRKELATGTLTLVAEGDDSFYDSAISSDGSVVSFLSDSTNVVLGDSNSTTDAFAAVFPEGPAVLAFNPNSGATPIVDVTGNYSGRFPGSRKPYRADVAMDESGKVVALGTVDGYKPKAPPRVPANSGLDSNPDPNGVVIKGAVKTVNNVPTVSGTGNVKGGKMDDNPIGGSGKLAVPLVESPTKDGSEFNAAVVSGSATVDGKNYKKPPTLASVPAASGNGSKDWSVSLNIFEKIDSRGQKHLWAKAILYLPNDDQTEFKERKLTRSRTGLYSTVFAAGTKVDEALVPIPISASNERPKIDRKSRLVITALEVEAEGDPRQPTAGKLSYRFLGQSGSGDLLDFF